MVAVAFPVFRFLVALPAFESLNLLRRDGLFAEMEAVFLVVI